MITTVVLVFTIILILAVRSCRRPPGFPPGPGILPVVGSIPFLLPNPAKAFENFPKKYGDIVGLKIFSLWSIMINEPSIIRASMSESTFSGRRDFPLFKIRNQLITGTSEEPLGILGTEGETWKNQRRFTLRTLKDFGFGRRSIEPIMQKELEEFVEDLTRRQGEKIRAELLFNRSIINVIWATVSGKRFEQDNAKLAELSDKVNKMMQTFNPFHPAFRYPWIKKLFPNLEIYKKTDGYMIDLLRFIEQELEVHQEKARRGEVDDGSYAGVYLREIEDAKTEGRDTPLHLHHLKANIVELFIGGSETTSSTLWWAIYLLATNQDVQKKIQEELKQVIGIDNLPTLKDMDSLPYTNAAIFEVMRMGDLIPMGVPHRTTQDTTLEGYRIPKHTFVLLNLTRCLKSKDFWERPNQFYPEHFLTPEGKLQKPDAFMPFGTGKRICLGESLARLELFLFFTTLVHRFTWTLSDDPVTWEKHIILSRPPNFSVIVTRREKSSANEERSLLM